MHCYATSTSVQLTFPVSKGCIKTALSICFCHRTPNLFSDCDIFLKFVLFGCKAFSSIRIASGLSVFHDIFAWKEQRLEKKGGKK